MRKTIGVAAIVVIAALFTGCPMPFGYNINGLGSNGNPNETSETLPPGSVDTPKFLVAPASGGTKSAIGSESIVEVDSYIYITTDTSGTRIYYTTDGSTPSASHGTLYSDENPILVSGNNAQGNVTAIAYKSLMYPSMVANFIVTVQYVTVAAPTFTPASGSTFTSLQTVTISTATAGATIWYTTDGSTPVSGGGGSTLQYTAPITITQNTTVKAIATKTSVLPSAVSTATYSLVVGVPTIQVDPANPAGGFLIIPPSPNDRIAYTTDGSTPTPNPGADPAGGATVSGTVSVTSTIRAIAYRSQWTPSSEAKMLYALSAADYDTMTRDKIAAADAAGGLTTSTIDNSDGNLIPMGTVFYYRTGAGFYGALVVTNTAANFGLTYSYTTYYADGTVAESGTGVQVLGTYHGNLDSFAGGATDFWLENQTSTQRDLVPENGARFFGAGVDVTYTVLIL